MTDQTSDDVTGDELRPMLRSVEDRDGELTVVVRLANGANRSLHYVADVRAVRYDPAIGRLTIALSDEGRELIPGAVQHLPTFRSIDPGGEAELTLRVPDRIVKLAPAAQPDEVAFTTTPASAMQEVVVEMAWSDIPFYRDTRPSVQHRLPAVNWQRYTARTSPLPLPDRPDRAE